MFEMYIVGDIGGYCTARYDIILDKSYTVNEFINAVLTNNEWGCIGIYCKGTVFGKPCCRYNRDKLLSRLPDNTLSKKVVKARATGGWSQMDYILWIE